MYTERITACEVLSHRIRHGTARHGASRRRAAPRRTVPCRKRCEKNIKSTSATRHKVIELTSRSLPGWELINHDRLTHWAHSFATAYYTSVLPHCAERICSLVADVDFQSLECDDKSTFCGSRIWVCFGNGSYAQHSNADLIDGLFLWQR